MDFELNKIREEPTSCYGCSVSNPAKACYKIKQLSIDKKSGYYWVKPPCGAKPLRVYCHFETPNE